jgi:hypothetical protein
MTSTEIKADRGMTGLNLFGLLAVTVMVVSYALERRSPRFILLFAVSCLLASTYGFLQGAWPFGAVESVWCVIALKRWWSTVKRLASGEHVVAMSGSKP